MPTGNFRCKCSILAACLAGMIACGTGAAEKPHVLYYIGDVRMSDASGTTVTPAVRQVLDAGIRIQTGPESFIVIQIGESALVKIEENTTASLSTILREKKEIALSNGKALSIVKKLLRDETYTVKTPNAFAAVRGTEFSVSCGRMETIVAVRKGTVIVSTAVKDEKTERPKIETIGEGNAAVVSETLTKRLITADESREMEKMAAVPMIPDIEKKSEAEIKTLLEPIITEHSRQERLLPRNLDDIKAQYGRVDEVLLYSGKTYQGVILQRKPVFRVLTLQGEVTIPEAQVKNTKVIR